MATFGLISCQCVVSIPTQAEPNVNKHAHKVFSSTVCEVRAGRSEHSGCPRTALKSFKPVLVSGHPDTHTLLKYDLWQWNSGLWSLTWWPWFYVWPKCHSISSHLAPHSWLNGSNVQIIVELGGQKMWGCLSKICILKCIILKDWPPASTRKRTLSTLWQQSAETAVHIWNKLKPLALGGASLLEVLSTEDCCVKVLL